MHFVQVFGAKEYGEGLAAEEAACTPDTPFVREAYAARSGVLTVFHHGCRLDAEGKVVCVLCGQHEDDLVDVRVTPGWRTRMRLASP